MHAAANEDGRWLTTGDERLIRRFNPAPVTAKRLPAVKDAQPAMVGIREVRVRPVASRLPPIGGGVHGRNFTL